MIDEAIRKIILGENLSVETSRNVMLEIMNGSASNSQIASFLTAMRMKGETIDEITACATIMREKSLKITPNKDVLDIVGTGGDGANTFNISTVSTFVVSATGISVAKHGNRSVSSRCGSADLLETLGANINLSVNQSEKMLEDINMCFMYAPSYHSSMKYAAPVRKELGIRTIFNILGPLANPAGANMQLLGVYDEKLVYPLAKVLQNLGVKRGAVVYGHDGLDEISLSSTSTICEIDGNSLNSYFLSPEQLGLKKCNKDDILGGNIKENAKIALDILSGIEKGAKRDIVIMNSAMCLYMVYNNKTLKECVKVAEDVIDSGKAKKQLNKFIELSNKV